MPDSSRHVDLYFDFCCPWSYLALVRLQDVCERNRAELRLKPVSVARVLETENPAKVASRFADNPAKASWQRKDIEDWARLWGLTIDLPDDWPQQRNAAGAAALAACESGGGIAFCLAAFRAEFAGNENLADNLVLERLANASGLDAAAIVAAAADAGKLEQVQRNSLELIERGGFGTPTMFVGDELFFGNDRIPLVEWTLGPMADDDFVVPGQHSQWK